MTIDETAAVLRKHQGPFFNGIGSNCSCGRPVRTADEWARHVVEEQRAAEAKARTITTVEQVDNLAVGAILLDGDIDIYVIDELQPINLSAYEYRLRREPPTLPARLLYNPEGDQ